MSKVNAVLLGSTLRTKSRNMNVITLIGETSLVVRTIRRGVFLGEKTLK
jgi:hypothetical protein